MPAEPADITKAVALLRSGRLVAFPTETVYGLGADATNPTAIEFIYKTKGRPTTNPLIVHVADIPTARRFVTDWPDHAQGLAERFWPGPLTIILPKRSIPDNATAGLQTVGVRVPNHPLALELLRAFGGPLAAPSANRSTRVSPTTAQHVRDEFPDSIAAGGAAGEPSLILDGGPCTVGIESTVLDLSTTPPSILRPGQVAAEDLTPILGTMRLGAPGSTGTPAKSPGQQDVHYAPRAKAYSFPGGLPRKILNFLGGKGRFVLVIDSPHSRRTFHDQHHLIRQNRVIFMPPTPEEYARVLYKTLRDLDERGAEIISIEMPPQTTRWAAVRDRLTRATVPLPLM